MGKINKRQATSAKERWGFNFSGQNNSMITYYPEKERKSKGYDKFKEDGFSTLHIFSEAVEKRDTETVKSSLKVAKSSGESNLRDLLLSPSGSYKNALHHAVARGDTSIVVTLLHSANESISDNQDTLKKLLLSFDSSGKTTLHCAAEIGNTAVVQQLLDFAKSIKNYSQIYLKGQAHDLISPSTKAIEDLLLFSDEQGETALHAAAKVGSVNAVKILLLTADHIGRNTLEKLLISTNESNETALHAAAERGYNCSIAQKEDTCKEKYTRTLEKLLLAARYIQMYLQKYLNHQEILLYFI